MRAARSTTVEQGPVPWNQTLTAHTVATHLVRMLPKDIGVAIAVEVHDPHTSITGSLGGKAVALNPAEIGVREREIERRCGDPTAVGLREKRATRGQAFAVVLYRGFIEPRALGKIEDEKCRFVD